METPRNDDFTKAQHETMGVPDDVARIHRALSAAQHMVYLKKDEADLEIVAELYEVTPDEVEKKLLKVLKTV